MIEKLVLAVPLVPDAPGHSLPQHTQLLAAHTSSHFSQLLQTYNLKCLCSQSPLPRSASTARSLTFPLPLTLLTSFSWKPPRLVLFVI